MNDLQKILLLGEVHGTEANIWALQFLVRYLKNLDLTIVIALELPVQWQEAISRLNEGDSNALKSLAETHGEEYQSGRLSEQHIIAYERMVKQGIKFFPIREDGKDWNQTDIQMKENILRIISTYENATIVATVGNMHAQKKSFEADWLPGDYICHPIGELLNHESTSAMIRYKNCKYRNFGTIGTLNDETHLAEVLEYPALVCADTESNDHDCEIWVRDGSFI